MLLLQWRTSTKREDSRSERIVDLRCPCWCFFCLRFGEQANCKSSNELFVPIRYTIPGASGDLRDVRRRPRALPLGVPLNRAQRNPDVAGSNPVPTEGSDSSRAERRTEVAGSNPALAERPGSSMAECAAKEHRGWNDEIRRFAGSAGSCLPNTPEDVTRRPRPRPGPTATQASPMGTAPARRVLDGTEPHGDRAAAPYFIPISKKRRLNQKLRPCRTFKEAKRCKSRSVKTSVRSSSETVAS